MNCLLLLLSWFMMLWAKPGPCYNSFSLRIGDGAGAWMDGGTWSSTLIYWKGVQHLYMWVFCSWLFKKSILKYFWWIIQYVVVEVKYSHSDVNNCGLFCPLIVSHCHKVWSGSFMYKCVWRREHCDQTVYASLHNWFPLLRQSCLILFTVRIEMN